MSGPLFITGHKGLAGSALVRAAAGRHILTAPRTDLDLREPAQIADFLRQHRPSAIIHAAARNGGISLHQQEPTSMLADNLAIATHLIREARHAGIRKFVFISSACVYAGTAPGPQPESAAATQIPGGPTAGYALAKMAGMMLVESIRHEFGLAYTSIIPCNLYGPGDNYHLDHATVVPAMMRRMHEAAEAKAPQFSIWGSGSQTREFLHADDLASACLRLADHSDPPPRMNCGPGISTSMLDLAAMLRSLTGYGGTLCPDHSKPEGGPRPALDCSLLRSLGWQPRTALPDGLFETFQSYLSARGAGTLRGF